MIEFKSVSKKFDDKKVFTDFSFTFQELKCHGIIGLNGAGKSTFFNLLSSYIKSDAGVIFRNGSNLKREDILFLETNNYFYPFLSGEEYLDIFKLTNPDFNLEELNKIFQLPLKTLVEEYSTGMKKKLAMLSILKQDRDLYIFDEPFNGLDIESNHVVEMIIKRLMEKGKTIFISSHILKPLEFICDEFHYMETGVIVKSYPKENYSVLEKFISENIGDKFGDIVSRAV